MPALFGDPMQQIHVSSVARMIHISKDVVPVPSMQRFIVSTIAGTTYRVDGEKQRLRRLRRKGEISARQLKKEQKKARRMRKEWIENQVEAA